MDRWISSRAALASVAITACFGLVAGCGSDDKSTSGASSDASPSSPTATASPTSSPSASGKRSDVVANPPAKSWQDALAAARKEFSGDLTKLELEPRRGGGLEYKVELVSKTTEFAVQYDAKRLGKRSSKRESLGDDAAEDRRKGFDPDSVIGLDRAVKAAREQQAGIIGKWKIEGKDTGRVQYEFDVRPSGASEDVEVQIDAKDGSVVKDN